MTTKEFSDYLKSELDSATADDFKEQLDYLHEALRDALSAEENISYTVFDLSEEHNEVSATVDTIQNMMDTVESKFKKLHPVQYKEYQKATVGELFEYEEGN